MFGIKTYLKNKKYFLKIINKIDSKRFPNLPINQLSLYAKTKYLKNYLENQANDTGLSDLNPPLNRFATNTWKELVRYNPNNIGNWSSEKIQDKNSTQGIENEVVTKMINLFNGDSEKLGGYITSGGTEGNIFSAWMGTKFLSNRKIDRNKICIIITSLTHYSINKAADILGLQTVIVALNEKTWGIDVAEFEKEIKILKAKGIVGFLVPLTIGYTLTGTSDPIDAVCKTIKKLENKLNIATYTWIDASFSGLVEPFINNQFSPFKNRQIKSFIADFHKNGMVPLSAGIIIYRQNLSKLIKKKIDYLDQKDLTLLGSRSGLPAVAAWLTIHSMGKKGFVQHIRRNMKQMSEFIQEYKANKNIQIVSSINSLNCAIILKRKTPELSSLAKERKLNFMKIKIKFTAREKILNIAKCFFIK